jgi:hypothetical protein
VNKKRKGEAREKQKPYSALSFEEEEEEKRKDPNCKMATFSIVKLIDICPKGDVLSSTLGDSHSLLHGANCTAITTSITYYDIFPPPAKSDEFQTLLKIIRGRVGSSQSKNCNKKKGKYLDFRSFMSQNE